MKIWYSENFSGRGVFFNNSLFGGSKNPLNNLVLDGNFVLHKPDSLELHSSTWFEEYFQCTSDFFRSVKHHFALGLCLCLQDPNSHLLLVCLKFGHAKFVPTCVIKKTYRQFLLDRGMFREQSIDVQLLYLPKIDFVRLFLS